MTPLGPLDEDVMVNITRRQAILGTVALAAGGAGVTAAASGFDSVEGQADVQAEQALVVEQIDVPAGQQDATFTRVSDDNTAFQAAVELNNGDEVRFQPTIRNNSGDELAVEIDVQSPDVIDVAVGNEADPSGVGTTTTTGDDGDMDANTDDANADDGAVRTGETTWVATIASTGDDDTTEVINIDAELDDTAPPGSYDLGVTINPLSTDN